MCLTEIPPFEAEFAVNSQQRHEVGGEGVGASLGFGTGDSFHRNFDHAEVDLPGCRVGR